MALAFYSSAEELAKYRDNLKLERDALIKYAGAKLTAEDWHGLCDAANDLRDVDSELRVIDMVVKLGE